MDTIAEISKDQGVAVSALCDSLSIPRASYYRKSAGTDGNDDRKGHTAPQNALASKEKQEVLDTLHSAEFVDKSPYDVYYTLLDRGHYICSPRTMYRLLEANQENNDRRCQRSHRDAVKPELVATQPNEVWSWDITKLLSEQRLVYYHLYVILDLYSRYVVGWLLADKECQYIAKKLIQATALKQGIQPGMLTIHSDNGPSMKSQTVASLLDHLGIGKTHNRPYTSNDNPFSESHFKTLKYCPQFPGRFGTLQQAEQFCRDFFRWYNLEHYHSGICWLRPKSVHYGEAEQVLANRQETLHEAFAANPARFSNKQPKVPSLPEAVYINPPQTVQLSPCGLQDKNQAR